MKNNLWEYKVYVKLIENEDSTIVKVEECFDENSFVLLLKEIKKIYGDKVAENIINSLIGILERAKLHLFVLEKEVFE